jgi:hypothetical protein
MAEPTRFRRLPVVALVAWTLFVWLTRVRNVAGDEDLSIGSQLWGLALAGSFIALAGYVVLAATRRRERLGWATLALAGWTVVVWIVRGVDIATGDHSAGFVVVHLLLGLVSIALAGLATRSVARLRDGFSVGAPDR